MPAEVLTPPRRDLTEFVLSDDPDLFAKAEEFQAYTDQIRAAGVYQVLYRLELLGPLDHRITVRNPFTGLPTEMVCFDSNSYLGLHLHPRVVAAMRAAVEEFGIGTPSAQVLGGTNRYLIALEELLSDIHGRTSCLVFPSGYQANVGVLTGLLRPGDFVLMDVHSHASLQDGCRYSGAHVERFPHGDLDQAEALLVEHRGNTHSALVVTDGLFSMHGDLANVPALLDLARRYDARLYVDDAHGLGVIGEHGRGVEDHFGCEGETDVLMGTFSKAPGAAGGYVCGDSGLIDYLRFFGRGSLFTASLPAPVCAGVAAALEVMFDEPEHRERLWANTQTMAGGLRAEGLRVPSNNTPIVPVFIGNEDLLPLLAIELFQAGVKAGIVQYPAVARGEAMLRFTINARHDETDLQQAVEVMAALKARYDLPGAP
jgi:glycine C-acetyltransferase